MDLNGRLGGTSVDPRFKENGKGSKASQPGFRHDDQRGRVSHGPSSCGCEGTVHYVAQGVWIVADSDLHRVAHHSDQWQAGGVLRCSYSQFSPVRYHPHYSGLVGPVLPDFRAGIHAVLCDSHTWPSLVRMGLSLHRVPGACVPAHRTLGGWRCSDPAQVGCCTLGDAEDTEAGNQIYSLPDRCGSDCPHLSLLLHLDSNTVELHGRGPAGPSIRICHCDVPNRSTTFLLCMVSRAILHHPLPLWENSERPE